MVTATPLGKLSIFFRGLWRRGWDSSDRLIQLFYIARPIRNDRLCPLHCPQNCWLDPDGYGQELKSHRRYSFGSSRPRPRRSGPLPWTSAFDRSCQWSALKLPVSFAPSSRSLGRSLASPESGHRNSGAATSTLAEPKWLVPILNLGQSRLRRMKLTYSHLDPALQNRMAWNAGKTVGTKRPLTQKQIWAIRFFLDREEGLLNYVAYFIRTLFTPLTPAPA